MALKGFLKFFGILLAAAALLAAVAVICERVFLRNGKRYIVCDTPESDEQ